MKEENFYSMWFGISIILTCFYSLVFVTSFLIVHDYKWLLIIMSSVIELFLIWSMFTFAQAMIQSKEQKLGELK